MDDVIRMEFVLSAREQLEAFRRAISNVRELDRTIQGARDVMRNAGPVIEFFKAKIQQMAEAVMNAAEKVKIAFQKMSGFMIEAGNAAKWAFASVVAFTALASKGIEELTKKAADYQIAMLGLAAVSKGWGQSSEEATIYAKKLASDGLMSITQAATTLKNLIGTGFDINQSFKLALAMKDIGAFNNVIGNLGQAMEDSSKGLKINSMELIENIGLTQRMSSVLKAAGIDQSAGIDLTNNLAQRMAVYNSILKQGEMFHGNAAKYVDTYSGAQARLGSSINELKRNMGEGLMPMMTKVMTYISNVINKLKQIDFGKLFSAEKVKKVAEIVAGFAAISGGIAAIGTAVALLTNPITWILVGIAAIALAVDKNFLGIGDTFRWLKGIFETLTDWIQNVFGALYKGIVWLQKEHLRLKFEGLDEAINKMDILAEKAGKVTTNTGKAGTIQIDTIEELFKAMPSDIRKEVSKLLKDNEITTRDGYARDIKTGEVSFNTFIKAKDILEKLLPEYDKNYQQLSRLNEDIGKLTFKEAAKKGTTDFVSEIVNIVKEAGKKVIPALEGIINNVIESAPKNIDTKGEGVLSSVNIIPEAYKNIKESGHFDNSMDYIYGTGYEGVPYSKTLSDGSEVYLGKLAKELEKVNIQASYMGESFDKNAEIIKYYQTRLGELSQTIAGGGIEADKAKEEFNYLRGKLKDITDKDYTNKMAKLIKDNTENYDNNQLEKIKNKYKDNTGYTSDIEKKIKDEHEQYLVDIGKMRKEETQAYKTFVNELENLAGNISKLANNLENLTGNKAYGLLGNTVSGGMDMWKQAEALKSAGGIGSLAGASAALGLVGAGVGIVAGISSYMEQLSAEDKAARTEEWKKVTEEDDKLLKQLQDIADNTRSMSDGILSLITKSPTMTALKNGRASLDNIVNGAKETDSFSALNVQTNRDKWAWGIHSSNGSTENKNISTSINGNSIEDKIAKAKEYLEKAKELANKAEKATEDTTSGVFGEIRYKVDVITNIDAITTEVNNYIEMMQRAKEASDNFEIAATLDNYVGGSFTEKKTLMDNYEKQLKAIYDPKGDGTNAERVKKELDDYEKGITGTGKFLVTIMEDVNKSFVSTFANGGVTSGEAFLEGVKPYFGALKTNLAKNLYNIDFDKIDAEMKTAFGGISDKMAAYKVAGGKDSQNYLIGLMNTDLPLENIKKALKATETMDDIILAGRKALTTGKDAITDEQAKQIWGLTVAEKVFEETASKFKSIASSAFKKGIEGNGMADFNAALGDGIYESAKDALVSAFEEAGVYKALIEKWGIGKEITDQIKNASSFQEGLSIAENALSKLRDDMKSNGIWNPNTSTSSTSSTGTTTADYYSGASVTGQSAVYNNFYFAPNIENLYGGTTKQLFNDFEKFQKEKEGGQA